MRLIAEALELISDIEIRWIHFGDGILFNELQKKCHDIILNHKNIRIELPGNISNKDVLDYYKNDRVDAIINVSTTEGIPVSIMETMSFGIPTIATNVGGTHEIVEHEHNGFLLSQNPTREEIAETLKMLHSLSRERISEIREQAYNTWKHSYNSEINYRTFIADIL